ncbi:iron ABC transporter permease [Synechococcus sp. NOUM97013]|uniref:ABC transporter permease n=1 Tax=Synechococcus sp. NOUM97013 TaxID=1442555 RepID=UPI0016480B0E|nr:iron ABC transporter permease [Synechococcus sp. NOUM97013]
MPGVLREATHPRASSVLSGRLLLVAGAVLIAALALLPIAGLLREGLLGLTRGNASLGPDGLAQVRGTVTLLLGTASLGGLVGTANGWLLANCRFPGRRWLRIAQLLPLATPSYLLAATLIDLGSLYTIHIHGMGWGIAVMGLTTYPYVFLLSTESFSISGRRQLEACRSLGVGPWSSFRRIALPMALPAIGAGIALMGMEVANELGAVQLLGIPSLSAGILQAWQIDGNATGAVGLALITLCIVLMLLVGERWLRRRSRRWSEGVAGGESPAWTLQGGRAVIAQCLGALPPLISLGIPLTWAGMNAEQLTRGFEPELVLLTVRSLGLALAATLLAGCAALLLSIAKRWSRSHWLRSVTFLAGMGYAIPGAVLALALLLLGGPWQLSPILLLLWGYSDRFLAVNKGSLDAALERLSPSLDEAATGLGLRWPAVLRRVHFPLLRGPILAGGLLVFVDTVKELPLTWALRPFDFDTLAVRVYQYAGDERLAAALWPALMILTLGLLAASALIPRLDRDVKPTS